MKENDEAKKFRERQKLDSQKMKNVPLVNSRRNLRIVEPEYEEENEKQEQRRNVYRAKAGTAHRANENKKKGTLSRLKLASIILAAGLGIGAFAVMGNVSKANDDTSIQTITQLEEAGVDVDDLSLEDDTLELFEKYDEFFANYDPDTAADLSDEEIIEMAEEIKTLNFNAIKDNVADLLGVTRDDVTLRYTIDREDKAASVIINEDDRSDRETYTYTPSLLGIGGNEGIPEELADLIFQIGDYSEIIDDVENDKITNKKAISKLQDLYNNISETVGVKDMELDEDGNIILVDYDEQIQEQTQETEISDEEER